jgi:hypothetical protein
MSNFNTSFVLETIKDASGHPILILQRAETLSLMHYGSPGYLVPPGARVVAIGGTVAFPSVKSRSLPRPAAWQSLSPVPSRLSFSLDSSLGRR